MHYGGFRGHVTPVSRPTTMHVLFLEVERDTLGTVPALDRRCRPGFTTSWSTSDIWRTPLMRWPA